ncbi:MAG TPA: hypothetical protein VG328_10910 [Stellaceae bacterium]|nr:hypothetical protein [Stellaceae bacterium]
MRGEIVIHSLADARAALAAAASCGRNVILASAPSAALQAGPGWFKAVIEEVCQAYPQVGVTAILDCGDQPGAAMAALRLGLKNLRFHGGAEAGAKLEGMGAIFAPRAEASLDLREISEPETACTAFLQEA